MVSPLDRTPRICTALGTPGPCLGQSSSKQTSQIHRLHLLLLLLLSRFSRVRLCATPESTRSVGNRLPWWERIFQWIKESTCPCRRGVLDPGLGRSSGGGNGNALQCCLGNPIQRSLGGYSPWGHKESNKT